MTHDWYTMTAADRDRYLAEMPEPQDTPVEWNTIESPDPLDPHDTLADPERGVRVNMGVNDQERRERAADAALSDFGSAAFARRWRRDEE